jgi:hypothetical protein
MFTKPTVLILGAGASAEVQLPIGSRLKELIGSALDFRFSFNGQTSGDPVLLETLRKRYGRDLETYTIAGGEFSKVVSSFVSIDEALHYYSGRPEVVLLGKLAIARLILQAERGSVLYSQGPYTKAKLDGTHNTWMPHFLSMASSGLTMREMDRAFRNVTLINFNYDRSVEYYLYVALQERLNLSADLAQAAADGLKVIRPYGSVGLPSWHPQGMPYGGHEYENHIDFFKSAEGIRTYTEQNIGGETLTGIRESLEAARLVLILGFGFHDQNIALLSAGKTVHRNVFVTVNGIAEPNHLELRRRITRCLKTKLPPKLLDMKASHLLEQLRPSIMLAAN